MDISARAAYRGKHDRKWPVCSQGVLKTRFQLEAKKVADGKVLLLDPSRAATMSSKRAKGKTTKKRPQRATSNVFAMFDQSQIQEFKEAFNMIDQNRDGFIDKEDLHDMLASMGKNPSDEYLEEMMNEAPGSINFTMFLTMFGERLNGTDPEDVIRNAFACFDEEGSGVIHEDHLRELLTTMGDRFTDEEVDELFREAPIDKKGNFNYAEFTRILKHGAKEKDDE
ncbi:Myosin regulatory light polypeptide 9 [Crenichthys baileyi]|uniref:Myosin regulatory light polypeptide 9 n=2 Tax=Goodeidae TaxID=28758 RepID=A0AAV9S6M0_9TELE